MTFEEKCSFAIKELENAKIWKSNYNPPFVKLIHKLGFKVPFPHYNSFLSNTLSTGAFFGVFWGLLMYFFVWNTKSIPLLVIALSIIFSGVFFGVAMASYYKYSFRKHKLTPWYEIENA